MFYWYIVSAHASFKIKTSYDVNLLWKKKTDKKHIYMLLIMKTN